MLVGCTAYAGGGEIMCRRGKKGFWIAVPARGARLGGNPKTFIKVQQKMSVFFGKIR
jgi:hypothetical protein